MNVDRLLEEAEGVCFERSETAPPVVVLGVQDEGLRPPKLVEPRLAMAAAKRPADQPLKLARRDPVCVQVVGYAAVRPFLQIEQLVETSPRDAARVGEA